MLDEATVARIEAKEVEMGRRIIEAFDFMRPTLPEGYGPVITDKQCIEVARAVGNTFDEYITIATEVLDD